jgi:signal transduction histidine kinase
MTWSSRSLSIRTRLTLRWTAAFAVLLAVANLAIYLGSAAASRRDLDAQVRTLAATELASSVDEFRGQHLHEVRAEGLHNLELAPKFAQFVSPDGRVLLSTANLRGTPALLSAADLRRATRGERPMLDVIVGAQPARMTAVTTHSDGGGNVLLVGLSDAPRRRRLGGLAWLLSGVWLGGLLLTAWLGFVLATRALAPIDHITRRAASIARGDFAARLDPPGADDEIGRMTALLNEMLDRLHGAIEANRHFASDASHELRSPITAMAGEIDVALKRDRPPEEYRETLAYVRDGLRQMTALTENLMLLARTEEHREDRYFQEVPLGPLVDASIERLRPAAARRGIALVHAPDGPAVVYGDGRLYARVFDNLLINAVNYNRDGGSVRVESECVDARREEWTVDRVLVRVSDTGGGIPPADWDRVFERFRRLDSSRTRRTGGTGLGLAICRAVVTLFGGSIRVAGSSAAGTTFELDLPGRRATPGEPTDVPV